MTQLAIANTKALNAVAGTIEDWITVSGQAAMVLDTPVAARQRVLIRARTAGNVAFALATGSILIPVDIGDNEWDFAVTTWLSSGTTADCDVFTQTTNGNPFTEAYELVLDAAPIAARSHVFINCEFAGDGAFTLSEGGTEAQRYEPGPSLRGLAATQLVAAGTDASLRAWNMKRGT